MQRRWQNIELNQMLLRSNRWLYRVVLPAAANRLVPSDIEVPFVSELLFTLHAGTCKLTICEQCL